MRIHKRIINAVLPIESRRRERIKRLIRGVSVTPGATSVSYEEWVKRCEPLLFADTTEKQQKLQYRPRVSVVVPCYNTPDRYLDPLLESVLEQVYQDWELVLADGSTDTSRIEAICAKAKQDKRIRYIKVGENLGIVGNTNIGLKHATGDFVAFMDHDDTLSPYALAEMVIAINEHPGTELLYSDEDKLSDDGRRRLIPFFKPDWSPDLLLSVNYITHFVVVKKSLVEAVGGLRKGFDGAQDYDFLLRITEKTDKIHHVPKMLYHWRLAEGSTAKSVGEKNYADTAGQRALKDAVKRRKIKAEVVEVQDRPTNYRLRYQLSVKQPLVSIVIPFKDKVELLKVCVPSILKSSYKNYEIILLSNNSSEPETHSYLDELRQNERCRVFIWNHPFNYSALNNFGRKQAKGSYMVFLNNDTKVLQPDWLEELVGVASQEGVGAVGPLLLYPDHRIQHAGVVLGMNTMAGHVFRLRKPEEWTDFGIPLWPRNYLAVTGACLAVKASKFDKAGGFDEMLTVGGNDVALGIRLYESGLRNVYWPLTRLIHYENVSVGSYESSVPIGDYDRSLEYYRPYLNNGDPYYNSNLDLMNEYVGIRSKYE